MLTLINEDLFSFKIEECKNDRNPEIKYQKIKIITSSKLVRQNDDRDLPNNNVSGEFFTPIVKNVLTVTAPTVNYNEYTHVIKSYDNGYGPNLSIRSFPSTQDTIDSNIFVIAIPFSGMLKPLKSTKDYKLYKAFIASSARPFWFEGTKYRKVLYLIIEPNVNLFVNLMGPRKTEIGITVESFGNFRDRDNEMQEKCNHDTSTVTIKYIPNEDSTHYPIIGEFSHVREIIDHSVMVETKPDERLWELYHLKDTNGYQRNQQKSENKPFQRTNPGSNRPSFNKPSYQSHNPRPYQKPQPAPTEKPSIDQMIESSGMKEAGKAYQRNAYYGAKDKKKGKGNKKKPYN